VVCFCSNTTFKSRHKVVGMAPVYWSSVPETHDRVAAVQQTVERTEYRAEY
jgi:uncharacterized small protein (DUF1192 family)